MNGVTQKVTLCLNKENGPVIEKIELAKSAEESVKNVHLCKTRDN